MQITFTADTQAALEAQMKAFLTNAALQTQYGAGRPLPSWAPAGSRWVAMPGAPALYGPDGQAIPVVWVGAVPTPGHLVVNRDAAAEAQGAALLASIRGTQP